MRIASFVLGAACAALLVAAPASAQDAKAAAMSKDERMQWWRTGRFGMFIHWGLYSPAAGMWKGKDYPGAGEWLLTNAKADPVEYRATLMEQFNPVKFNADEWAQLAKDAGMQYVVITTKHHDGFCLWDSATTDYDVMSTPFKRDIMKELSEAVRAKGLRMCWYHSIMDWSHPDYLPRRAWDKRPADPKSFPRYVEYLHAQLRELLTKYGPIGILWFDGEWEDTWTHDWGKRTDDLVRSLQPQIIVNNRVDTGRAGMEGFSANEAARGDYGTPEQTIPPNGMPGKDWETCMTMNDTWGFKASDTNWKSSREMIRMLCDIASKGGNFLLNVGPRGDGTIPPESVQRLHDMGAWLKVNGEAIYGTRASPFPRKMPWGRVTLGAERMAGTAGAAGAASQPGSERTGLYFHVFDWPADGVLRVPGLGNDVISANILGSPDVKVTATRTADGVQMGVPKTAPNADATVIHLVVAGKPNVAPAYTQPGADGRVLCTAADASVTGSLQYETRYQNLGFWGDATSTASWLIKIPAAGRYRVTLDYASDPGCAGEVEVALGTAKLTSILPARTGWGDFAVAAVGEADIPDGGPITVVVRAVTKPGSSFINLRSVTLTPVK